MSFDRRTPHRYCALVVLAMSALAAPQTGFAQAVCVGDGSGRECLDSLVSMRGPEAEVMDVFQTSDGRYAPELTFATYLRGVNGCIGGTGFNACTVAASAPFWPCRNIYSGYVCGAAGTNPPGGNDPAFQANSLDWYWTQVNRTDDAGALVPDGSPDHYVPWRGRIMDIGGEANRVVLFPITDHDPLPCEAFEYSVWLSNNPDATAVAPESAPDPNLWNPARLIQAFTEGWTRNPLAEGVADAGRADLGTFLRDDSNGNAIADALATVWALPCGITFRYVAIQAGNYGNPSADCAYHSSDDELDAVAGLNEDDTAICVDADGDGHRDAACGGSDCDDTDPDVHPGAFEPCDSLEDLNCAPAAACPSGTLCDAGSGLCLARCFEGGCAEGFSCTDDRCVESLCAARAEPCAEGTLCRGGECVAPCDGVVCPSGQSCVGGACLDPCEGVVCPSNQVCIARDPTALTLCGPSCDCDELVEPLCPDGTACDDRATSPTAGECVDPGCEVATCGPGEYCADGVCADACAAVVCPIDQVCTLGECVTDLCGSVVCPGTQVCREGACFDACDGVTCPTGQECRDGACVPDPCFGVSCPAGERCAGGACVPDGTVDAGGGSMDAGPLDGGAGGGTENGGCGCRASGSSTPAYPLLGLLALVLVGRRRTRR